MNLCSHLFVYGSLLTGSKHSMADFLSENATLIMTGYFKGKLYEVNGYPGAIYTGQDEERVFGQIVKLRNDERVLNALDRYEEIGADFPVPNEYVREIIQVVGHSGELLHCWVYLYNWPVDALIHIPSGNYRHYLEQK